MPLNCVVYGCSSSHKKDKRIKFFRFPQNEEYKKKWVDLCKRKEPINTDVARVCSLHFEPSAFKRLLKYELLNLPVPPNMKRLLDGALPTLNMPNKQVPVLPRRDAPVLLVQSAIQPGAIQQAAWPNQPVLMVQSPNPLGQLNQSTWSNAPVQVVQSTTPGGAIQPSTWSNPPVQVVQSTSPCVLSTNTLGSVNQSAIGPVYVIQPTGLQGPVQQSACSKAPILLVQSPTPCGPLRKDELGANAPAANNPQGSETNPVGSVQENTCNVAEQREDSSKRKHSMSECEEFSSVSNVRKYIKKEMDIDEKDVFTKEWEVDEKKQEPSTFKAVIENNSTSNVAIKKEPGDGMIVIKQENDIDSIYLIEDNIGNSCTTQSPSISEPEVILSSTEGTSTSQKQTLGRPPGAISLVSQSRNVILNVFKYFRRQGNYEHIEDLEKRTAEATQVSLSMVRKIRRQGKRSEQGIIESPDRKKKPCHVLDKVNDISREAIRREILSFYERGELPTLYLLLQRVTEPPISYQGSRSTLWKLVKELGFKYKKHKSSRGILMERTEIVASRNKYLQEIEQNQSRKNPKPEIYLDETWVNQSTCAEQRSTGKEGFIIVHAGGAQGFIPGALLIFQSKFGNKYDYNDCMDSDTFKQWFVDQLLPNIPPRSLIVMDNAHYHNALLNEFPTINTQKTDIIKWLVENSIPHDATFTRPELLQLIKLHKKKLLRYEIDELAAAKGHRVIRLPPYYCQLNPTELIWARMKEEIKMLSSNTNLFLTVEELIRKAIENVSPENWKKCIEHTRSIEGDYRKKDIAFENMFESFAMNLSLSDSSSDESDASE